MVPARLHGSLHLCSSGPSVVVLPLARAPPLHILFFWARDDCVGISEKHVGTSVLLVVLVRRRAWSGPSTTTTRLPEPPWRPDSRRHTPYILLGTYPPESHRCYHYPYHDRVRLNGDPDPACLCSFLPGRAASPIPNAKRTDIWAHARHGTAQWHWHANQWHGTCMTGGKCTSNSGTIVRLLTCQLPAASCPVHTHGPPRPGLSLPPASLPSCPPPSVPSEPPPTSLSSPHPSALLNPPFSRTSSPSQSFPSFLFFHVVKLASTCHSLFSLFAFLPFIQLQVNSL